MKASILITSDQYCQTCGINKASPNPAPASIYYLDVFKRGMALRYVRGLTSKLVRSRFSVN